MSPVPYPALHADNPVDNACLAPRSGQAEGVSTPAPPPVPVAGLVRRALDEFVRAAGTRRAVPTVLHLGTPGGEQVRVPDRSWHDAGSRADLVARALEGLDGRDPLAWLCRRGSLCPTDVDLAWLAACRHGYARHGLGLAGFYLVTREGWADLVGGSEQRWSRVRPVPHAG